MRGLNIHFPAMTVKGITARQLGWSQQKKFFVHPTVLLGVVDHHQRLVPGAREKRVVGALLGTISANEVHITNSYAIPFEEDVSDGSYADSGARPARLVS